ncbi:type II toxin-antitoxin system Rv0910 family toxin [Wenjunlia tyrosinilytica]|uniref:Polyketide cyclase n=1 Tax=Wenjunlia tyrosinilytica TaxID=1544741 RepID=A0A917ZJ50_9ACTN|nr:SRPBCC family protein [Wenjunlia tyrosinilytica]GGO84489.1 hypothetical protein GCM10012280_16090 [Wenjunlia tyrosinilytica]
MAEVHAQAHITAPPERVWDRLTDFECYGQWNATHTGFPKGVPDAPAKGESFQENMRLMGFPAEVTWTVEECEAPRVLSLSGNGPMGVALRQVYRLVPGADGGTDVAVHSSFTGAAVSLMASKLENAGTSALAQSLSRLADVVRASA